MHLIIQLSNWLLLSTSTTQLRQEDLSHHPHHPSPKIRHPSSSRCRRFFTHSMRLRLNPWSRIKSQTSRFTRFSKQRRCYTRLSKLPVTSLPLTQVRSSTTVRPFSAIHCLKTLKPTSQLWTTRCLANSEENKRMNLDFLPTSTCHLHGPRTPTPPGTCINRSTDQELTECNNITNTWRPTMSNRITSISNKQCINNSLTPLGHNNRASWRNNSNNRQCRILSSPRISLLNSTKMAIIPVTTHPSLRIKVYSRCWAKLVSNVLKEKERRRKPRNRPRGAGPPSPPKRRWSSKHFMLQNSFQILGRGRRLESSMAWKTVRFRSGSRTGGGWTGYLVHPEPTQEEENPRAKTTKTKIRAENSEVKIRTCLSCS